MSEKNQEKDLNNKESKIKRWREKHKKSIRNTFLTLLAAGAVYHTADKWTSAQYFDESEAMGKTLVELQSEGDLTGYKNTLDQRESLKKEIKNVEERIDKLGRKRQELEIDLTEGKVQAARDITPIPHAKGLERRTFKEYQ